MTILVLPDQLVTDRLLLRLWRDSDVEPFANMCADPIVMAHFPSTATRDQTEQAIQRFRCNFNERKFGLWAIELKETQEFLGFVGLIVPSFESHFTPCVEIGWRLAKEFWGNGYAPEAAREAIRDGFERVGLSELVSMTATTNLKSIRVMEKIGMTRNPLDDFDHPNVSQGHRLRRHVLYRLRRSP